MSDFGPVDADLAPSDIPELASEPIMADRVVRLSSWRSCLRGTFDDSPSWLVSFVLHLVGFLLIASISVPWRMENGGKDEGTLKLTLGFADQTESTRGEELTLDPEPVPNPQDDVESTPATAGSESQAKEPTRRESRQRAPRPAAPPSQERPKQMWQPPEISTRGESDPLQPSPYAALLNRNRPPVVTESTTVVAVNSIQRLSPEVPVPPDPRRHKYDKIVDDFIAFDIGQLRGAAGKAAMRRFSQLGSDAIPALVRGLNKAASIHASCPVGVIAGKLVLTLQKTQDRSLRQYAIDKVGQDVPVTAPHFSRLQALKKHWLTSPKVPERVATYVQRMETRAEGELMELMLALSDSDVNIIAAALRSGDDYLAGAATLALIQGGREWNVEQRAKLRAAINDCLQNTDNKQLRGLAADANRTIAG